MKQLPEPEILERRKQIVLPRIWPIYLFFFSSVGWGVSSARGSDGFWILSAAVLFVGGGLFFETWQEQMGTVKADGVLIYRFLTPRFIKWDEIENLSHFSSFILVKTRKSQVVIDLRFYKNPVLVAEFAGKMVNCAQNHREPT